LVFNEETQLEESSPQPAKKIENEIETETLTYTRRKPKSCGRQLDTSKLLREQRIYDLPNAEKTCVCGCQLEKMGQDIAEQIEHIPEQLKVIEHVQIKYTCRQCETIKTAAKLEAPLPKCMAGASLIAETIIKKYDHHLPLYRQSKIFAGQGLDIPDNTLGNWVMGAAEALSPLQEAAWQQVLKTHTLQVDETPVTVLKPHKEGYMWAYHSCDTNQRFMLFEFTLSRAGEHPQRRLADYKGNLQTDGYSGYNKLRSHPDIHHFGCWDHCRRKFTDVVKISGNNKSGKAGDMLALIEKLYQVEDEARGSPPEERKVLRQEKSKPILALLHARLQKIHAPPQSTLGKAVQYSLNQWPYLCRHVDYGEVEISNCWIENQIRPFALGRRNWLFVGNEVSANKSAFLYSLIQSCKLNAINPRHYLRYVLNKTHAMRRKEIDPVTLLPQFIDKNLLLQ
jgi:transposase